MTVRLLLDAHAIIAENLLWDAEQGVLYWTDIKEPALYRLDPDSLRQERWALPDDVGAMALADAGRAALVALRDGIYTLSFASGAVERLAEAPWDARLFRFNEGMCDREGRFWVGCMFDPPEKHTLPPETGPLHSWMSSEGLRIQGNAAECHNGMALTADGQFIMSHSMQKAVYIHAKRDGALGPAALLTRIHGEGIPDGAALDEDGAYWCAIHGGGCLHRYAPDGTLLQSVALPVSQPTMCAFGGADLRRLFISSASDTLSAEQRAREPHAGGLFVMDAGVRGLAKPVMAW